MPYKSDAQRRFMHARHPEIASRWDEEIRRKRKVKKSMDFDQSRLEVPFMSLDYRRGANYRAGTAGIGRRMDVSKADAAVGVGANKQVRPTKVAGRRASAMSAKTSKTPVVPSVPSMTDESKCPIAPSLVGKGLGTLLRGGKKAAVSGPIVRHGVTRMGTVGVEVEHEGVKAWGANESAAHANLALAKTSRVNKAGDWKTIDQREVSQRRARKTQRRGAAAIGIGATTAYGVSRAYPGSATQARTTAQAAGRGARNVFRQERGLLGTSRARSTARAADYGARTLRLGIKTMGTPGKVVLGSSALAAAGAGGIAQGRSREAYHQHKINERRRANAKRGVSKRSRTYDAEDRRQRRLASAATAATIAGGLLVHRGGKRIYGGTKAMRSAAENFKSSVGRSRSFVGARTPGGQMEGGARPFTPEERDFANKLGSKGLVYVDRKAAKPIAGGAALLATGGGLGYHSRGRANRRWD